MVMDGCQELEIGATEVCVFGLQTMHKINFVT